ncbi:GNAT family N-acetyltransferase, partial [bacterium AH-315-M05]|nr:GNAT family N-acetyltransferase [bacterium AH-315-M05]
GQIRINQLENETIINMSVDEAFRGRSLTSEMFIKATDDYLSKKNGEKIYAYIFKENLATYYAIKRAGFIDVAEIKVNKQKCFKVVKERVLIS